MHKLKMITAWEITPQCFSSSKILRMSIKVLRTLKNMRLFKLKTSFTLFQMERRKVRRSNHHLSSALPSIFRGINMRRITIISRLRNMVTNSDHYASSKKISINSKCMAFRTQGICFKITPSFNLRFTNVITRMRQLNKKQNVHQTQATGFTIKYLSRTFFNKN